MKLTDKAIPGMVSELPGYGSVSEALPEETGSNRSDRTYGVWRHSSTLPNASAVTRPTESGFSNPITRQRSSHRAGSCWTSARSGYR
jgi:hypothetical protein